WGDSSTTPSFSSPQGTIAAKTHTYADNGSYTVTVKGTDNTGDSDSKTFTVTVANVAPTVAITGAPSTSPEGTAITLGSTISDPSSPDTSAGFAKTWSVTKNGSAYGSGGSGGSFSFTPTDNGNYVVSLSAKDKDKGVGSDSKSVTVVNVSPHITSFTATDSYAGPLALTSSTFITDFSDPGSGDSWTNLLCYTQDATRENRVH